MCGRESDLHSKIKCLAIQLYFFVTSQAMIVFNNDSFMQIVAIIYGSLYFWFSSLVVSSVHQVYNTKRFDPFYSCMVIFTFQIKRTVGSCCACAFYAIYRI